MLLYLDKLAAMRGQHWHVGHDVQASEKHESRRVDSHSQERFSLFGE